MLVLQFYSHFHKHGADFASTVHHYFLAPHSYVNFLSLSFLRDTVTESISLTLSQRICPSFLTQSQILCPSFVTLSQSLYPSFVTMSRSLYPSFVTLSQSLCLSFVTLSQLLLCPCLPSIKSSHGQLQPLAGGCPVSDMHNTFLPMSGLRLYAPSSNYYSQVLLHLQL